MSSGRPRPFGLLPLALGACVLAGFAPSPGFAAYHRDRTPLPRDLTSGGAPATLSSGTGSAAVHMVIGLAVVLALIFAIYKLLKRTSRRDGLAASGDGLITVVSSTPLGASRSLHLVSVGEDVVLVGAAEQSITPIRVYSRDEARRLGIEERAATPAEPRPSVLEALRKLTTR